MQNNKKPLIIGAIILLICLCISSFVSIGAFVYLQSLDENEDSREQESSNTDSDSEEEDTISEDNEQEDEENEEDSEIISPSPTEEQFPTTEPETPTTGNSIYEGNNYTFEYPSSWEQTSEIPQAEISFYTNAIQSSLISFLPSSKLNEEVSMSTCNDFLTAIGDSFDTTGSSFIVDPEVELESTASGDALCTIIGGTIDYGTGTPVNQSFFLAVDDITQNAASGLTQYNSSVENNSIFTVLIDGLDVQ